MTLPRLTVTGCLVLILAWAPEGHAAGNKEKIVGKWQVTDGQLPKGSLVVFTRDGKFKVTVQIGEKKLVVEGKYEIDDNRLKTISKDKDGKDFAQVSTIKRLTRDELVTKEAGDNVESYKKAK
jgi:uncharacterized protein (TIGR03066 family)